MHHSMLTSGWIHSLHQLLACCQLGLARSWLHSGEPCFEPVFSGTTAWLGFCYVNNVDSLCKTCRRKWIVTCFRPRCNKCSSSLGLLGVPVALLQGYTFTIIHRTNLIGDEIHHHLVLASEKYDAMTTCWPQPLRSHSGKTTEELLFNKYMTLWQYVTKTCSKIGLLWSCHTWRPCVPGHWQTIGIKTPKMNSKSALATFTGNRTCTSRSKVCSKSLWPSSKMQHTVPKHIFFSLSVLGRRLMF